VRELRRGHPDAIVRPRSAEQAFRVERRLPRTSLQPYVDYHWLVRWDVDEPYTQQVVPQPRIHVAAEHGRLVVHGVSRKPFSRTLTGRGHVLGASFRPGAFRPVLGGSVAGISGRVAPAGELLGPDDRGTAATVLATEATVPMVEQFEQYLERVLPERPDPVADEVAELVARAEHDRGLTRADALAVEAGMSLRSLQRLFSEYVGIRPKWVIQRFRLLDVAAAAHSGEPVDWAALALDLGFSDQAHLTRSFTQVVGTPPESYRRDL
jgi:AraC-like DNA-binding protein